MAFFTPLICPLQEEIFFRYQCSLYYGLTFFNCPLSLSPISMIQILFSTNISFFPHAPYIFHIHLIFFTNISHFPQMLHIFHKCLHFSHILHISHQHMCSFFFFYFHAHSTVASLCSYIGASLRVINTSIAPQGGYNQSIHRFLAVNKKRQRHNQRLGYKSLKIFL